ncbi:MAG: DUF222 domain-containing protein [Actinomycetota bacterium]
MSELGSAVEALRAETLAEMPDALIEENFTEMQRASEQIELERLRRIAEIDRRGIHRRDGHLSVVVWLVDRFRVSWGSAREAVRTARSLGDMGTTRRALEEGGLSMPAARALVAAREVDPPAFAQVEDVLVEAARTQPLAQLKRAIAHWRERVERERPIDREQSLRRRRHFHASVTFEGMVRVDGDLDPETGESLLTALRAATDAEVRSGDGGSRTPARRRADALGEICRGFLDRCDRPQIAGERPHITLTVDASALATLADATAPAGEFDHVGPASPPTARRLACDASVMRVVTAGRSEPLDVGRRTPIVPPSMRRAVVVRDVQCRFPGCDRPHTWCDAHHVQHWADGGSTATSNLLLLCRPHHRLVHRPGGFRLELVDGQPVFRRPDGSALSADGRAPP